MCTDPNAHLLMTGYNPPHTCNHLLTLKTSLSPFDLPSFLAVCSLPSEGSPSPPLPHLSALTGLLTASSSLGFVSYFLFIFRTFFFF